MRPRKNYLALVKFSKIYVVLNKKKAFEWKCIVTVSEREDAKPIILWRNNLLEHHCQAPEHFVAAYIILFYVINKYGLRESQPIEEFIKVPCKTKVFSDVIMLHKKLEGKGQATGWFQSIPSELLPPKSPFSFRNLKGNYVLSYKGSIRSLHVVDESILEHGDFTVEKNLNKLFDQIGQQYSLSLQECEQVIRDSKYSTKSEGIFEILAKLHRGGIIPKSRVAESKTSEGERDKLFETGSSMMPASKVCSGSGAEL